MAVTPKEMQTPPQSPDYILVKQLEYAVDEWLTVQPKDKLEYIYYWKDIINSANLKELADKYRKSGWIVQTSYNTDTEGTALKLQVKSTSLFDELFINLMKNSK